MSPPRRSGRKGGGESRRAGDSEEINLEKTPDGGFLSVYKGAYFYEGGPRRGDDDDEDRKELKIDDDDDDDEPVIIENEVEEQEDLPPLQDTVVERMRSSLGSTRDRMRVAFETSKEALMQTPQHVRNWRRLSISDEAQSRVRRTSEDEQNKNIIVLGALCMVALLTFAVFFPYVRATVDPASANLRIENSLQTLSAPFDRFVSGVHTSLSKIIYNVSSLKLSWIRMPSISKMEWPQFLSSSTSRAPKMLQIDLSSLLKSTSASGSKILANIQGVAASAGLALSSSAMAVVSVISRSFTTLENLAIYATDRYRFVSREEFGRMLEDSREVLSQEDLEERIKRFIENERQQIREGFAKAKAKTKGLRTEVIAELRARGERAAESLDAVKEAFVRSAGNLQLKQRNVVRDLRNSLSSAIELPAEKIDETKRSIASGLEVARNLVEENCQQLVEETNAFIAREEEKIRDEISQLRATIADTSEVAFSEVMTRKERALNGLKRSRESVGRMANLWRSRQSKQIDSIQKSLFPVLERARSRPRYVLKAEVEAAIKQLKESLNLDDVEDQVLGLINDEIRQVNAKLVARQKLTREQLTLEVLERVVADKGGRPDFALMSAGAYVVSSSPSVALQYFYAIKDRFLALIGRYQNTFLLGLPNSPSLAIQPETTLGKCWGFPGNEGNLTIHLARPAIVDAFTVEHAPRSSVYSMSSAPRTIRIYGYPAEIPRLASATAKDEFYFGELDYSIADGEYHMQYYPISDEYKVQRPTRAIRVEVVNNHGSDFTCVYRIRVHGIDA